MRVDDLAHALSREWSLANERVFGGGALLAAPTIEVEEKLTRTLGQWSPADRTMRFSGEFVRTRPWWVIVEVLKHEMAHEYVSDVLGVEGEETSHGPAFRMICDRHGIDGRAGHSPTEEETRVVEKARKLLTLATSSNEHEAQAALSAALRLLGQHGLDEEDLRERSSEDIGVAALGEVVPKHELHHLVATTILAKHFGVRPVWVHRLDPRSGTGGLQLEVVGARQDLAMAEYVHGWLHATADRLCTPGLRRKERLDFLAGVMVGHLRRLDTDATSARAHAPGRSQALVVLDDESAVEGFFERRHPRTRSSRSGSRRRLSASFFEGQTQGRNLGMSKPLDGGSTKLLGR